MLWGWPSPRHMKRGLPHSELQRLDAFYDDYGRWQQWLVPKEDDSQETPADWEADTTVGPPV